MLDTTSPPTPSHDEGSDPAIVHTIAHTRAVQDARESATDLAFARATLVRIPDPRDIDRTMLAPREAGIAAVKHRALVERATYAVDYYERQLLFRAAALGVPLGPVRPTPSGWTRPGVFHV